MSIIKTIPVALNIAGNTVTFDFDGKAVYKDGDLVERYYAPCGCALTQKILVTICREKLENN